MDKHFVFDGQKYRIDQLTEKSKHIHDRLVFIYSSIEQLNAKHAVMTRARNAYIDDLKSEVIENKSGVNIGALFLED